MPQLRDLRLDVDVGTEAFAVFVEFVFRLEARETLRARWRAHDTTGVVRSGFTGRDAVTLLPRLDTQRHVYGRGETPVEAAHHAGVQHQLVVFHRPRVDVGLRQRAVRSVEAVLHAVRDLVGAIHQADVGAPAAKIAAYAPAHSQVVDVGGDQRQKPSG